MAATLPRYVKVWFPGEEVPCYFELDKDGFNATTKIVGDRFQGEAYAFRIDPLSGDRHEGMWGLAEDVRVVPVQAHSQSLSQQKPTNVLVDEVAGFRYWPELMGFEHEDTWWEEFACEFLARVSEFLCRFDLMEAKDGDPLRIMLDGLSELGLDFMRQHYRRLKERAVRSEHSSLENWDFWLERTLSNRSRPDIWDWQREVYCTQGSQTPSTLPLSFDSYPLLQCQKRLKLCGPRIDDLSLLKSCVRLDSLDLNGVSASGLQVLDEIPSLTGLHLTDMDFSQLDVARIPELIDLELERAEIHTFDGIEQLQYLDRLCLTDCIHSEESLQRFREARPEVRVCVRPE